MNHQLSIQNHERAAFDATYYTLGQLKGFYARASIGIVFAAIASWGLSSFFIAQYLAGAEFEYINEWGAVQFVYAFIGIMLATVLTMAEVILFNSGKVREFWLMALVSVLFSVFSETSAAMQREQTAVKFKSQQSEVFKATLAAANNLANTNTLSPTQIQLLTAQQALNDARALNDVRTAGLAQARITRLETMIEMGRANNAGMLSTTLDRAKSYEYDEGNHQAIIKLMSELFGWSHVITSGVLALFLVVTFKFSMHYLGGVKSRNERAIAINTGALPAQLQTPLLATNPLHVQSFSAKNSAEKFLENQSYLAALTTYKQSGDEANDIEALYKQFVMDLKADKVGTSQQKMKDWIKSNLEKPVALFEMQGIADELLKKALGNNAIKENPDYVEGNRKPKYLINRSN